MASRSFLTRVVAPQIAKANHAGVMQQQARGLSSNGIMAVEKLREALEEYRMQHYTQETPQRMKKEIIRAAKAESDDRVVLEGLHKVIVNIGVSHKVSREDVETIFSEIGQDGYIPAERMLKMI